MSGGGEEEEEEEEGEVEEEVRVEEGVVPRTRQRDAINYFNVFRPAD